MTDITVRQIDFLKQKISLPADKSISHRAVIIGSISEGATEVSNFLNSQDCLNTLEAYRQLGVNIKRQGENKLLIKGAGLKDLKKPDAPLYFGNSGTGARLSIGLLSAQRFESKVTGDESLSKRPMKRITDPLSKMGARIKGRNGANYLPLEIKGGNLKSIHYHLPVASAQVKSSILLAGLYSEGQTCITEPQYTRDHTERMLSYFGAKLKIDDLKVCVDSKSKLTGRKVDIPNDLSAAVFFIVAASLIKDAQITLSSVGINPTRLAVIDVLKDMKVDISIDNKREYNKEPRADFKIKSSKLKAIKIDEDMVPLLIDELPILMVAATQAEGTTVIKNASELRVKETDRISSMVDNLTKLGADIKNIEDDIIIKGPTRLKGTEVPSYKDHRTAMSMCIAGLVAEGQTKIVDTECIKTSFPDFSKIITDII